MGRKTYWGVLVALAVLCSVVVHAVYSFAAPVSWLEHRWEAGDFLVYVGTVALAIVSVWQNKRQGDENLESQVRLERINAQMNELRVISHIIDVESKNIERLEAAFDAFSEACDPQMITTCYAAGGESALSISVEMTGLEMRIDEAFFTVCRCLRTDLVLKEKDDHPLNKSAACYYQSAKELVRAYKENPLEYDKSAMVLHVEIRREFMRERERYLGNQQKKLNATMYGNLSLDEIKEMYSRV